MAMKFFSVAPSAEAPDLEDTPDLSVRLFLGGLYFFLYPFFLRLRDETGQMIDPSEFMVHFENRQLPDVLRQLEAARKSAEKQPEHFQQHIGRQFRPVYQELYETVSRSELLDLVETLIGAVSTTRQLGHDVYLFGH